MTLRHFAFSRQHRTQFSEDVYAFVLWRYVAVQIWRVKDIFVPGIVASTIKFKGPGPYWEKYNKIGFIYITNLFFYELLTVLRRRPIRKRVNFHE